MADIIQSAFGILYLIILLGSPFMFFIFKNKYKENKNKLYLALMVVSGAISVYLFVLIIVIFFPVAVMPSVSFVTSSSVLLGEAMQYPMPTFPSSGDVNFKKGDSFSQSALSSASNGQKVCFETDKALPVVISDSKDSLNINSAFKDWITVCCTNSSGGVCKIGIGTTVDCRNLAC